MKSRFSFTEGRAKELGDRIIGNYAKEAVQLKQLKEENEQLTQLLIQEQEEVLRYKPIYLKLISEIVTLKKENKKLKERLYEIQSK